MSRPASQQCPVCQSTFGDSDCVHWTGTGTTDDPYIPVPNIDDDVDNLVECGPNGVGAFLNPIYADPPACHAYGNIAEDAIVPWDTAWPLAFTEKRYDTDNMLNPDDAPGRITFNTPGIYLVTLNVRWKKTNDSAATGDLAAFIRRNGADYLALDSFPVPGGDSFAKFSISREHPFAAGDYVDALVKQDVVNSDDENMNLPITIERMSPIFTAMFLRPIEGMTIVGVDTTDANPGGGSGGIGSQYALNGTQWWETPDDSALDILGDIDFRTAAALTDWTPSATPSFADKQNAVSDAYQFMLWTSPANGYVRLHWWATAGVGVSAVSSAAPTVSDGAPLGLRATLDVNNGGGSYEVKFWTKPITAATALTDITSDAGWTQLGTTQTGAATSIQNSTQPLKAGLTMVGNLYSLVIKNGINGTVVANPDFYHNNSPFTDGAGRTWTKN